MTVAPPGQCPDISLKLLNSSLPLNNILFLIAIFRRDICRNVSFLLCMFLFPLGGFVINAGILRVLEVFIDIFDIFNFTLLVFFSEPQYLDPCVREPSLPRVWPDQDLGKMTESTPSDP